MGALALLEIGSNFIQYVGVIGSVKIQWPSGFEYIGNYLRYLRIDFTSQLPNVNIPTLDFRSQLVLYSNALPLFVAILLLIFFKSVPVVLTACVIIGGIGLIVSGIVLLSLPTTQFSVQSNVAQYLIIGGAGAEILVATGYLVRRYLARRRANKVVPITGSPTSDAGAPMMNQGDNGSEVNVEAIKTRDRYGRRPHLLQLRDFCIGAVLTFLGLIITGCANTTSWNAASTTWYNFVLIMKSLGFVIGWVFFAFGLAFDYIFLSNVFRTTRRFNRRAMYFLKKNAIKIVLFLLGFLYIPMATSILSTFSCTWITAPAGSEFVRRVVSLNLASLQSDFSRSSLTNVAYTSCHFRSGECPIADMLCPESSDLRLVADQSLSCNQEIYPFYLPGAIISLFTIVIGIPWLFYKLIRLSSRFLTEFPADANDSKEKWKQQVKLSTSSCKSLYNGFEFRWRYYKLVTIIHKLLIVGVLIFSNNYSFALICALTATHSLFAVTSIMSRPYVRKTEDLLAIICLLINVGNALLALMVALAYNVPSWIGPLIGVLNIILPGATLVIGLRMDAREERERKAAELRAFEEANATGTTSGGGKLVAGPNARVVTVVATAEMGRGTSAGRSSSSKHGDTSEEDDDEEEDARLARRERSRQERWAQARPTTAGGTQTGAAAAAAAIANRDLLSPGDEAFIDAMDQELDARLLRIMVNAFMVLGFGSFIGTAVAVVGLLYRSAGRTAVSSALMYSQGGASLPAGATAASVEFAGYTDWTSFTANCCCQASLSTDSSTGALVNGTVTDVSETWKCRVAGSSSSSSSTVAAAVSDASFIYKTRARRANGIDGLSLRPYCSPTFNAAVVAVTRCNWFLVAE
ncbi:hypothetical protein BC828DRAFT_407818 [Blastocladiella britannica]|nr:hypothetical protein BC828DRAFT_407818 [Blastocladiella britannica]